MSLSLAPPRPGVAISDHLLAHFLLPVLNHRAGPKDAVPQLDALHLFTDGGYLYAEATQRYTVGQARVWLNEDRPLNLIVDRAQIAPLEKLLKQSLRRNQPSPAALCVYDAPARLWVKVGDETFDLVTPDLFAASEFPKTRNLWEPVDLNPGDQVWEPFDFGLSFDPTLMALFEGTSAKISGSATANTIRLIPSRRRGRPMMVLPERQWEDVEHRGLLMPCRPADAYTGIRWESGVWS